MLAWVDQGGGAAEWVWRWEGGKGEAGAEEQAVRQHAVGWAGTVGGTGVGEHRCVRQGG